MQGGLFRRGDGHPEHAGRPLQTLERLPEHAWKPLQPLQRPSGPCREATSASAEAIRVARAARIAREAGLAYVPRPRTRGKEALWA